MSCDIFHYSKEHIPKFCYRRVIEMAASFDSYKIFYYVGKYGNITRAANALFLSQSTVSRTIQSLEAELGCRLFERYPHGVALTEAGDRLFSSVSSGCELILCGENELKRFSEQSSKRLRIGANDFIFRQYLLPALAEFARFFPEVGIQLTTQHFSEKDPAFSRLIDGDLDLFFTFSPAVENDNLLIRTIAELNTVLIAGNRFQELRDHTVSYIELQNYPILVQPEFPGTTSLLEQTFSTHGVTLYPSYLFDTSADVLSMVQQGLCLAAVPEPLFLSLHSDSGIFQLRLSEPLPSRSILILSSRRSFLSPAGEELIRCFRRQISGKDNLKL